MGQECLCRECIKAEIESLKTQIEVCSHTLGALKEELSLYTKTLPITPQRSAPDMRKVLDLLTKEQAVTTHFTIIYQMSTHLNGKKRSCFAIKYNHPTDNFIIRLYKKPLCFAVVTNCQDGRTPPELIVEDPRVLYFAGPTWVNGCEIAKIEPLNKTSTEFATFCKLGGELTFKRIKEFFELRGSHVT